MANGDVQEKPKHRVFISYHHKNDQAYKNALQTLNEAHDIFVDCSVDTGEVEDGLTDEQIRETIRDDYLRDTSVTVLLVGTETQNRKHVDWELYSSMFDGSVNKKSGILVINLPSTGSNAGYIAHDREKETVYPEVKSWVTIDERAEFERRYPFLPPRIIDNLMKKTAKISVVPWTKVDGNPEVLSFLIGRTFEDRANSVYDLSRAMRRADS
jgi:hypothetical protein